MVTTAQPPVAIGGIGGSGTRLICEMTQALGFFMGGDLNDASDNLWFTLLFKRTELLGLGGLAEFDGSLAIFRKAMDGTEPLTAAEKQWLKWRISDRPQHPSKWLRKRMDSLIAHCDKPRTSPIYWGWKEPNTHIFLDRFMTAIPGLRYIHVMRHGLDIAFSSNQNQPRLWGQYFLSPEENVDGPRRSLRFWCKMQQRAFKLGEELGDRFLSLNFDDCCTHPDAAIDRLANFLKITPDAACRQKMLGLVHAPPTVGRFRAHGTDVFDPADVQYVKTLGFDVSLA